MSQTVKTHIQNKEMLVYENINFHWTHKDAHIHTDLHTDRFSHV